MQLLRRHSVKAQTFLKDAIFIHIRLPDGHGYLRGRRRATTVPHPTSYWADGSLQRGWHRCNMANLAVVRHQIMDAEVVHTRPSAEARLALQKRYQPEGCESTDFGTTILPALGRCTYSQLNLAVSR
jgi:hypothetical protein